MGATEILSREQLKSVFGGSGSGSGSGLSVKEQACVGKPLCAPCSYFNIANQQIYGHCSQSAFSPNRWCSDLNCFY